MWRLHLRPMRGRRPILLFAMAALLALAAPGLAFAPGAAEGFEDILLPQGPEAINRALNRGAPGLSDEQRPAAAALVDELTAAIGGRWSVQAWNPQTMTPRLVSGSGIEWTGVVGDEAQAEDAARNFVDGTSFLWGLPASTLEAERITHGLGKWSVHFSQRIDGARVLGSRLNVIMMNSGRVFAFGGDLWPELQAATRPVLTEEEAFARARAELAARGFADAAARAADIFRNEALGILPAAPESGHLVYRVRAIIDEPVGSWLVDVDAVTGELRQLQNYLRHAGSEYSGSVTGMIQNPDWCEGESYLGFPLMDVSLDGAGTTTTDPDGNFVIPGGPGPDSIRVAFVGSYVDVNVVDGGVDASYAAEIQSGVPLEVHWDDGNARQDERDVFFIVTLTHELLKATDPGWTDLDYPLPANVNIDQGCNAFWNGESINMFRENSGCSNTGEIGDVTAHEYGHGITDNLYGPNDPPGDLHEGNSDVNGNYTVDNSWIGRGWYVDDCESHIRDSDNDLIWPDDTGGGGHHDGQIIAGVHWDIWTSLKASLGDEAGKARARAIWHFARAMGFPQTQPEQVAYAFIADDDDGNLDNGTPSFDAICGGATHHGFECPEVFDDVVIHHSPTPYVAAPTGNPVTIVADTYSLDGELDPDNVLVYYREAGAGLGGFDSVVMTPTGDGDEWSGDLPSFPVETHIEYYVYSQDEFGSSLTDPRDAPASVHTTTVVTVYDAFEDDEGWTVGAPDDSASQGIWERVEPEGFRIGPYQIQPDDDATPDPGALAFITGQYEGQVGAQDADGKTTLISPTYDLTSEEVLKVGYSVWFKTINGFLGTMDIDASNDGGFSWVNIDHYEGLDPESGWEPVEHDLTSVFPSPNQFKLRVVMFGEPISIDEGGFDEFYIIGGESSADAPEPASRTPRELQLALGSENPIAGGARIRYGLPSRGHVSLRVVDVSGRLVATLVDGPRPAGFHEVTWSGRDASGGTPSGVYFIQLVTPRGARSERVVLLK